MVSWLRRALARVGRWPRVAAALACLLLAAVSALGSSRTQPARAAPGVAVVVAARDLPVGHRLTRTDLTVARWPPGLRPDGARGDPAGLVGLRLASPVGRREAVTANRVLGPALVAGLPAGTVATVVVVDQDVGSLIRPGDLVDLLAAPRADLAGDTAGSGSVRAVEVARGLVVVSVLPSATEIDPPGVSVVLGVERSTALRIAALRATSSFSVVGD